MVNHPSITVSEPVVIASGTYARSRMRLPDDGRQERGGAPDIQDGIEAEAVAPTTQIDQPQQPFTTPPPRMDIVVAGGSPNCWQRCVEVGE